MRDQVKKLLFSNNLYEFLGTFDVLLRKNIPTDELLRDAATTLSAALYQEDYRQFVPHGLMVVSGAAQAARLVPEADRFKPLSQALWYAATERKRKPYDLDKISVATHGGQVQRWERFLKGFRDANLKRSYGLLEGFIINAAERRWFRNRLFPLALKDTYQLGHKWIYVVKTWQLADLLGWNEVRLIFFPALHYLAKAPRDLELSEYVEQRLESVGSSLERFADNAGTLDATQYDTLEKAVLWGTRDEAFAAVLKALLDGAGYRSLTEGVQIAAAQSMINTDEARWLLPAHAFNYADACRYYLETSNAPERLMAPVMAALFVNAMARPATKLEKSRWPIKPKAAHRGDPLEALVHAVMQSNPAKAIAAIAPLVSDGADPAPLYRTLVLLAARNDGPNSFGHDIKCSAHAVLAHQRFESPVRGKLLIGTAALLASVVKSYVLHNELWA